MMRPFLKWAGNKYAVLHKLKPLLAPGERLIEPFCGACAVFLNTEYPLNVLADSNPDLINVFHQLQHHGANFIDQAQTLFTPKNNQEQRYYQLREQFNQTQCSAERAILFIYLNKHSYNGLCRYNRKGEFNVPFGQFKRPTLSQPLLEYFCEQAKQAKFVHQDYLTTLKQARPGDVVYCDPPYAPLSSTANFTNYSGTPFTLTDQITLAEAALDLAQRNITVLISNHNTPFTRKIYQATKLHKFKVRRTISCQGKTRTEVPELIAVF